MTKRSQNNTRSGGKKIKMSPDLLWGVHPVLEGLIREPARFSEIVVQRERRGTKIDEIVKRAQQERIKLSFVESIRLTGDGSSEARHQGVIARLTGTPLVEFSHLLEKMRLKIANGEKVRLMVCDTLQDPHNLGAIIRSALASGASGVLATRERSAPLGGTAAKSSAGAMSHLDICQVTNLTDALKELKKVGFWVFGAIKDEKAQSLYETDLNIPACFVVGSEGRGIRPLVKKECDVLISIPMVGELDSLNSSVAAAVILFEAHRQHLAG